MLRYYAKKIIIAAVIILFSLSCPLFASEDKKGTGLKQGGVDSGFPLRAAAKEGNAVNAWSVTPPEIDLGSLEPGQVANGLITLKYSGEGSIPWSLDVPEGWDQEESLGLTGELKTGLNYLRISIKTARGPVQEYLDSTKVNTCNVQLKLEAGAAVAVYHWNLPVGNYQEPLNIFFPGSVSLVFLKFKIVDATFGLSVGGAKRLDFGIATPGKQLTRRLKITNKGRETVKWRFIIPGRRTGATEELPLLKGKYVSFLNEENKAGGAYVAPGHLMDSLELSGKWFEHEGYPSTYGTNNQLSLRFSGTGIGVYLWRGPDMGRLAAYLDDQLIYVYDGNFPERGREELPIADGLPDGPHVLTFLNGEGRTIIEGINIYGKELKSGYPGWIKVTPDSGTTTRETDYANILLDTQQLTPGQYGEEVVIDSDQGKVRLAVFIDITPEQTAKFYDVYRYTSKRGYLYTITPQADASLIESGGYRKEGIAFRLFAPGAPGTTKFYRWYNAKKGDHFYSYDINGGGKSLAGYVYEGSIGYIGTSRLTNTRELYRWYNEKTGGHFYSTDQKGEGLIAKSYKFDGIAGYVR